MTPIVKLLSFGDVAEEFGLSCEHVRRLVVEERSLAATVVTLAGAKEPFERTWYIDPVDEEGAMWHVDGEGTRRKRGYVRVAREEADRFKLEHGMDCSTTSVARDATRWPKHETRHLRALRAAAIHFFATYEASQPDPPPKSEEIIAWLMNHKDHQVKEYLASAMAAILKPDETKPGPRRRRAP